MKVKDIIKLEDLSITSIADQNRSHENSYPLPTPDKIINKGAGLFVKSNFLLISWQIITSSNTSIGGGKLFKNRSMAKKVERLFNDNRDKLLSEILEMEIL